LPIFRIHLRLRPTNADHENGLLEPAEINTRAGYRRHTADQIATVHIIRRFRDGATQWGALINEGIDLFATLEKSGPFKAALESLPGQ
jgi:hypothetical protein